MRITVLVAVAGLLVAGACSSSDGDGTAADAQSPSAGAVSESAGDALSRQIQLISTGRAAQAYTEIHPEQQKLFSPQQYLCARAGDAAVESVSVDVLSEKQEPLLIPGTLTQVDSTTVTARINFVAGGQPRTDNGVFHEVQVDGRWTYTVNNPQEFIDCSG